MSGGDTEAKTEVIPAVVTGSTHSSPPPTPPTATPPHKSVLSRRIAQWDEPSSARPRTVGAAARPTRLAKNKDRKLRRMRLVGRTTVAFVAVIALLSTGVVWGYLRSTDGRFAQIAALDTDSTDIVDPVGQTGDETYLIVGTDTRAGASGQIGAGTVADAEGARSDTVMLVNIPADRSRVVAVSFPRDLDVERPVCQGWDNDTGKYTKDTFPAADGDKLNATYALGGPKCLVKIIQKLSGLKIGHFVGMDFAGFEKMVDEVGGVGVCTPTPLVDGILGTILPKPGSQVLDGRTALNYVRARHIDAEGNGDYGRIKRQQMFLSSLLRSALSNRVLFDPGKLNGFINAFTRETFVENINAKSLVTLGRSLQNVDAGAVTFLTVPTAGTTEWGNEIPRLDDIKAIFQAVIDDKPLPGEERKAVPEESAPTPAPPPAPVPTRLAVGPGSTTLQVSNASGRTGLAAGTADRLGAYGFQIYSVGNYTGTSTRSVVRYTAGQEAGAATVASSIPGAVLEQTIGLGSIIEVVLGTDFAGTVTAPTAVGTELAAVPTRAPTPGEIELPADLSVTNAADDSCK